MTDNIGLKIVPFLLITLLVAGGVEGFYRYADNYLSSHKTVFFPKTKSVTKRKLLPSQNNEKVMTKNYDIIVARGLFKAPEKKSAEISEVVEPEKTATISTIDFALIGTITGKNDGTRAILLDKKKKTQEIFYLGDGFENVIVKEISRGKVVLDVDGKDEVLLMEESKREQSPSNVNPVPGISPGQRVRSKPKPNKMPPPGRMIQPGRRVMPPDQK